MLHFARKVAIAQLGERKTEDLEVPCSIHGGDNRFYCLLECLRAGTPCSRADTTRKVPVLYCRVPSRYFYSMTVVRVPVSQSKLLHPNFLISPSDRTVTILHA